MGRYKSLKLVSRKDVPYDDAILIARMSPWGHGIAGLLLLGWSIAVPVFVYDQGFRFDTTSFFGIVLSSFSSVVIGLVILVCLVAGLAFLSSFIATLKSTNWTLIVNQSGLYVNLRSYTDFRLPATDAVVLFIPKQEVRRLKLLGKKFRVLSNKGQSMVTVDDQIESYSYLELSLYGKDLSIAEQCLADEKKKFCPTYVKGVTAAAKGSAVEILPDGIVKIHWKTRATRLTPSLNKTVKLLQQFYSVISREEDESPLIRDLEQDEKEIRLLDLVATGNKMDAVILARQLYGYDLTEAHNFICELEARK